MASKVGTNEMVQYIDMAYIINESTRELQPIYVHVCTVGYNDFNNLVLPGS